MKRIFGIIGALALSIGALTSCNFDYDYYEPAFFDDTIDWTIPVTGGDYPIEYKFEYYESKATMRREFDFQYRVIIDGVASPAMDPVKDGKRKYDENGEPIYTFYVTIPANTTGHLRSIVVECSTHIDMSVDEDYWTDWFPVISTVQLFM
ncbi:MAG: hypothetical protein J6037_04455 [Bacteroidales bacterium]|nr:hypothetical protein [Bacteroidales bacterium]